MDTGPLSPVAGDLRRQHFELKQAFDARALELGLGDVSRCFWYHTVDLGRGLVTPGTYDFRSVLDAYAFPERLAGMRALDVGSATGFFAFELERRGAEVTSVEVPSISALDRFPGESDDDVMRKLEDALRHHGAYTQEQIDFLFRRCGRDEFHRLFLDAPFLLCREVLGSKVRRAYLTLYELPDVFPAASFDLVLLGDVLLHTIDPLGALAAAARVCRGTLIVAQTMSSGPGEQPALRYVGGAAPGEGISWWFPNYACLEQLLRKLGFRGVRVAGRLAVQVRPGGQTYHSVVVHADRSDP